MLEGAGKAFSFALGPRSVVAVEIDDDDCRCDRDHEPATTRTSISVKPVDVARRGARALRSEVP